MPGSCRNLVYFVGNGPEVYGVDLDTEAVAHCRDVVRELYGATVEAHFQVAAVEELPLGD